MACPMGFTELDGPNPHHPWHRQLQEESKPQPPQSDGRIAPPLPPRTHPKHRADRIIIKQGPVPAWARLTRRYYNLCWSLGRALLLAAFITAIVPFLHVTHALVFRIPLMMKRWGKRKRDEGNDSSDTRFINQLSSFYSTLNHYLFYPFFQLLQCFYIGLVVCIFESLGGGRMMFSVGHLSKAFWEGETGSNDRSMVYELNDPDSDSSNNASSTISSRPASHSVTVFLSNHACASSFLDAVTFACIAYRRRVKGWSNLYFTPMNANDRDEDDDEDDDGYTSPHKWGWIMRMTYWLFLRPLTIGANDDTDDEVAHLLHLHRQQTSLFSNSSATSSSSSSPSPLFRFTSWLCDLFGIPSSGATDLSIICFPESIPLHETDRKPRRTPKRRASPSPSASPGFRFKDENEDEAGTRSPGNQEADELEQQELLYVRTPRLSSTVVQVVARTLLSAPNAAPSNKGKPSAIRATSSSSSSSRAPNCTLRIVEVSLAYSGSVASDLERQHREAIALACGYGTGELTREEEEAELDDLDELNAQAAKANKNAGDDDEEGDDERGAIDDDAEGYSADTINDYSMSAKTTKMVRNPFAALTTSSSSSFTSDDPSFTVFCTAAPLRRLPSSHPLIQDLRRRIAWQEQEREEEREWKLRKRNSPASTSATTGAGKDVATGASNDKGAYSPAVILKATLSPDATPTPAPRVSPSPLDLSSSPSPSASPSSALYATPSPHTSSLLMQDALFRPRVEPSFFEWLRGNAPNNIDVLLNEFDETFLRQHVVKCDVIDIQHAKPPGSNSPNGVHPSPKPSRPARHLTPLQELDGSSRSQLSICLDEWLQHRWLHQDHQLALYAAHGCWHSLSVSSPASSSSSSSSYASSLSSTPTPIPSSASSCALSASSIPASHKLDSFASPISKARTSLFIIADWIVIMMMTVWIRNVRAAWKMNN